MQWLYKNSNALGAPIANFKTEAGQKEFLDIGYGLGFTLSAYDGTTTNQFQSLKDNIKISRLID